ncbi:hypothetical protein ACI65C_013279 [Semiaphis heraclei]
MKTPASGSGRNKKAYYLADAMQFSVPFIKTLVPPSTEQSSELQPPPLPTSPTLEAPFLSPFTTPASPVLSQQINQPKEQFSSSRNKNNLKSKNKSAVEADYCVAEYFKAKKARLEANLVTNSYNTENKEALKMFLLSLMPEVEHFHTDQIKFFKRKI